MGARPNGGFGERPFVAWLIFTYSFRFYNSFFLLFCIHRHLTTIIGQAGVNLAASIVPVGITLTKGFWVQVGSRVFISSCSVAVVSVLVLCFTIVSWGDRT